jgi:hypothetical protein
MGGYGWQYGHKFEGHADSADKVTPGRGGE